MPERSELAAALSLLSLEADELALSLEPETPDALAIFVQWGDRGSAVACLSGRDGLVLHFFEDGNLITKRFGQLPGGTLTERRRIHRADDRLALVPDQLTFEHPRLDGSLRFDASRVREERLARIREALIRLATAPLH